MTTRKILLNYLLIILFTVAPILSVVLASAIAYALDAQLNEGGAHPAIFLGADIGHILVVMFVSGWLVFVTVPLGVVMLVVFTVWWIVQKFNSK